MCRNRDKPTLFTAIRFGSGGIRRESVTPELEVFKEPKEALPNCWTDERGIKKSLTE
jgi:hypothetical protein